MNKKMSFKEWMISQGYTKKLAWYKDNKCVTGKDLFIKVQEYKTLNNE